MPTFAIALSRTTFLPLMYPNNAIPLEYNSLEEVLSMLMLFEIHLLRHGKGRLGTSREGTIDQSLQ
jgi:hypothetical protein